MIICGLQKLTLLDYPSRVACTVFTYGCNYRCPFCHNAALVTGKPDGIISENEILSFLKKRIGVLDGVCITGGEPLLQGDIESFMAEIKSMGYSLKLDTNGSFPDRLKSAVEKKLVDYVAMDIKNSPSRYSPTVGVEADTDKLAESVAYLKENRVDYEFRTTVIKGMHDARAMEELGQFIVGAKRYYLQSFVDSGSLIGQAEGVGEEEMRKLLLIARKYVPNAELRGI